jgi:hypothetical protein
MTITIENTDQIVEIQPAKGGAAVRARVWQGQTASGVRVTCFITRIAVHRADDQEAFDRELLEMRPMRGPTLEELFPHGIPARLVLD